MLHERGNVLTNIAGQDGTVSPPGTVGEILTFQGATTLTVSTDGSSITQTITTFTIPVGRWLVSVRNKVQFGLTTAEFRRYTHFTNDGGLTIITDGGYFAPFTPPAYAPIYFSAAGVSNVTVETAGELQATHCIYDPTSAASLIQNFYTVKMIRLAGS